MKKFFLFIFLFIFSFSFVKAEELILFSEKSNFDIGEDFELKLLISSQENINAFEGEINFPQELLELKDIKKGNSLVSLWIKDPHQSLKEKEGEIGKIKFGGIIPGGYKGKNGFIFSLFFKTKKEGKGVVEIINERVLLNDGQGTPTLLRVSSFSFVVFSQKFDFFNNYGRSKVEVDREPPDFFVPQVAYDENLEKGKWFVVFLTTDKKSGIDFYQVKEVRSKIFSNFLGNWIVAESPYILKDQKLKSYIFVKAVDKSGNQRIVFINPPLGLEWYRNYDFLILGGGMLIILLLIYFVF